ncbi:exodeoxyribonuclease VII large subunit [Flavobacterium sp. Sd200]|uniref:exodeoxyribonuclease VII large subunit n=1 Tax=Flavobacterium sp. Sd200 TaxID=2692211 RepID=UPI0013697EE6|nr:exodeoxyribonuclease VII large subunit [Flavobacterium sp. Sd200]MXN91711.1 exodeoxyribonuclease VII large subunit [Flavobacterium sp. Sd200]
MQNSAPIKLSDLTKGITTALRQAFGQGRFWVIADVSNHSFKAEKGYHNFELVEKDTASSDVIARVAAKAWGNGTRSITAFEEKTGQKFKSNIHVLVLVTVEYHPVFGISANLLDIDTNFTLGVLEQQRHATLQRLVTENEFIREINGQYSTTNKQLPLGRVIQNVALLTSSISAGAEDFRHTLMHNTFGFGFRIDDYFVPVQGDKNAAVFLEKLIDIYKSGIPYDAVVITRGGGAQSDFLIFDNYRIARAAAKFPIPIITGLGHQKNQSLTDMMVHSQTKTPTKAAELIIAHNREFQQEVNAFQKDIIIGAQLVLASHKNTIATAKQQVLHGARDITLSQNAALSSLSGALARHTQALLNSRSRKLARLTANLSAELRLNLQKNSNALALTKDKIHRSPKALIKNRQAKLDAFKATVKLMSPENILKKGYAMVKVSGEVVSSAAGIEKGMPIEVIFAKATLHTTVHEKITHDGTGTNL